MNTFIPFANSAEPKTIGVRDGLHQVEITRSSIEDLEFLTKNGINLKNKRNPIIKGTLRKNAIITDIMLFSHWIQDIKYIVSEKFVECLKVFEESKKYHLFKIEIEEVNENFYLLQVPMIKSVEINFLESDLYRMRDSLKLTRDRIHVKNYEEYIKLINEGMYNFNKICIPVKYSNRCILNVQGILNLQMNNDLVGAFKVAKLKSLNFADKTKRPYCHETIVFK
jgi:hypothetical protein